MASFYFIFAGYKDYRLVIKPINFYHRYNQVPFTLLSIVIILSAFKGAISKNRIKKYTSYIILISLIGDKDTLYPDVEQTLKAAQILVDDGFDVMAYTTDDPLIAKKLEKIGCAAVMPLAAPIGSGLGILNPVNIRMIASNAQVPVLVDAGVGTASDACIAMELGCAGVLLNTALSSAQEPQRMAQAMKHAVIAGREAYRAGRMPKREMAEASSPTDGILTHIKQA